MNTSIQLPFDQPIEEIGKRTTEDPDTECESIGYAVNRIYGPDMVADQESVYLSQITHSKRGFDENLFQVSVRVVGTILCNLHQISEPASKVVDKFRRGEVFSLAVTRGISRPGQESECIQRVDGGYKVVINKRLIGGLEKAQHIIFYINSKTQSLMFVLSTHSVEFKKVWQYKNSEVSNLTGRVFVPDSAVLAEGFMANCVLETALIEERDGVDAVNFLRSTWPSHALINDTRLEMLAFRCAQKYVVFAPQRLLIREPLVLSLKLLTAITVCAHASREANKLCFNDVQKAYTFGIAGGTSQYIKEQLWQRRKQILQLLAPRSRESSHNQCPITNTLIKLLVILDEEEMCNDDSSKHLYGLLLAKITLIVSLKSLSRQKFRFIGARYLNLHLPAIRTEFATILGARILDETHQSNQEFHRLCA